ncbi:subtilisin-like protein [Myriangium duriaei CBS 260.36]|uniref:Subtilisin-like protein n=1 Tax=Myriangium duriaei CBS 260.36 TaxID=1168546 RepID=A0A9P4MCR8_9PEZI|nr:subtilisin-like protein [Myriangium duriaei CBS 260.36]
MHMYVIAVHILAYAACTVYAFALPVDTPVDKVYVSDRYIITLKPGYNIHEHISEVHILGDKSTNKSSDRRPFYGITHQYNISDFQGYAGHFDPLLVKKLRDMEDIDTIEPDQAFPSHKLDIQEHPISILPRKRITQKGASWGLHHISHKKKNRSTDVQYVYDATAGAGTYAYVLDTGIWTQHPQFEGRASFGYNALRKTVKDDDDTDGHGTQVAGIIGSKIFGVAKKCNMIAVKTQGPGGTNAIFLDGYNWAVNDIISKKRQAKAVINVSTGSKKSAAINKAIDAAFAKGITTVAAAGNDAKNASMYSPGSAEGSITVSATDEDYKRNIDANTGPGVAIFAPGVRIATTSIGSPEAGAVGNGTSYAAPFVAGLVLYFKGMKSLPNANATRKHLLKTAAPKLVNDPAGAKNLFAYNDSGQ